MPRKIYTQPADLAKDVAGYIVGTADGSSIYQGRFTFGGLQECRAIYTQYKTAEAEIKDLQREGNDVSDLVVYPVTLALGKAIKPSVRKEPKGFVVKFTQKRVYKYNGQTRKEVSYWKGNKKKPDITWNTYTRRSDEPTRPDLERIVGLFHSYTNTTHKASVFATKAEAEKIAKIFIQAHQEGHQQTLEQYIEAHEYDSQIRHQVESRAGYRASYEEQAKARAEIVRENFAELKQLLQESTVTVVEVK